MPVSLPSGGERQKCDGGQGLHSNDVRTCTAAVHCTDASDHLPVTADLAPPGHRLGADASVRPHHG